MSSTTGYYKNEDGYNIHYEKVGHGPCVVFMLPGSCGNSRLDFAPQLDGFDKEKFTLIAWDSPGMGLSRPPERNYKLHGIDKFYYQYDAETIGKMMTHLGYETFSVMGWSDGGKTALLLPINFPSRIEKLVVWGTLAYVPEKYQQRWRMLCRVEMWDKKRQEEYAHIYGSRQTLERIWHTHMQFIYTTSDICKDRVKNIRCPTFVLHGKKDVLIPQEFYDHLIAEIPDCDSYLFPDGLHDYHVTHSKIFNNLVQKFLLS